MTYEEAKKEFVKTLQGLATYRRSSDVFLDWLTIVKLSFQNTVETDPKIHAEREKRFAEIQAKYKEEDLREFPKLLGFMANGLTHRFGDFLGEVYMEGGFGNSHTGQFFTPYHLSQCLAKVNFDKTKMQEVINRDGYISVCEPSCGSGGTVVAFLEQMEKGGFNYQTQCLAHCTDLDPRCAYMCFVTLSLLHVPAVIVHGNTLSLEKFEVLHTHSLCMQWLKFRNALICGKTETKPIPVATEPPPPPTPLPYKGEEIQMELF